MCRCPVRVRKDRRSDGRETCVGGFTPFSSPPCYGERAERRWDIEWARPGTTWPPPLSKALALCHVAAHNEAARWASVILAPGLVFCLPENSLLCRAALRPTAVSFRTGSSVRLVMYDIRISIKAFNTRESANTIDSPLKEGCRRSDFRSSRAITAWRHDQIYRTNDIGSILIWWSI